MARVLLRLLVDALLVAALLFAGAGTLAWPRAWIAVFLLMSVRIGGALALYRVHPALLQDRARLPVHADQPPMDRFLVLAVLGTGFLGVPTIAALDAFRGHAFAPPIALVAGLGLALFTSGWILKQFALHANAFATATLRVQRERAHGVAETGVYAVVRHPFYAADPLILVGLGLWLESWLAVLWTIVPLTLVIVRLLAEERFLTGALPGYGAYVARVRHRLIPGIW